MKTLIFKGRNINVSKEFTTIKIKTNQPIDHVMTTIMRVRNLSTLQFIKEQNEN